MIFLKSDSLNANPESRALLAPNKAPWDGIDAQVKVVYYSSLQWTVDTSHRNIDSERELQRYLFFPLRTALCSLGKRHITYDAKWQQNDPPSNVSCPSWIKQLFNLDLYIFSCPIYVWTVFNYIIYLYVSWLRHTAGLINQCQGQMSGTYVQGRICSSSGTYVQLFRDRCSGTIVQRPASSIAWSSRKQLS